MIIVIIVRFCEETKLVCTSVAASSLSLSLLSSTTPGGINRLETNTERSQ